MYCIHRVKHNVASVDFVISLTLSQWNLLDKGSALEEG